jgi:hypothetical protein
MLVKEKGDVAESRKHGPGRTRMRSPVVTRQTTPQSRFPGTMTALSGSHMRLAPEPLGAWPEGCDIGGRGNLRRISLSACSATPCPS